MKKINLESPIPMYYQIKEAILSMIEEGEFQVGESIPSERELCDFFGVSRMTVNKAILTLVNEGVLYRLQGKGTFVAEGKIKQHLQVKGFTEQMKEKGLVTYNKILSFETVLATAAQKQKLEMPYEENELLEISILRYIENEPFTLETIWIPKYLCPDLSKEMLEGKSLYELIDERYGYVPQRAVQTIEPIHLNDYESVELDQMTGALGLKFRRVTYLQDGRPFEMTREVYRSDRYKYEIELR